MVLTRVRLQITLKAMEIGAPDDVGLEIFKKGAILQEEEQKHAEPDAQWTALTKCIHTGASISHTAAVMREICDAVGHEVTKEARSPSMICFAAHLGSPKQRCLVAFPSE